MAFVTQEQLMSAIAGAAQAGANANGNYLKLDNGVLIQWGSKTVNLAMSTATGVLYRTTGGAFLIPYPLAFVAVPPTLMLTSSLRTTCISAVRSTTSESASQGSVLIIGSVSETAQDRAVDWIAIGRWK